MFCHNCGNQVADNLQFCPNCGQPMAAAASPASPAGVVAPAVWTPPVGIKAEPGRWIGEGWALVKADIGMYMLVALVVSILSSVVPLIIQGPLLAGFHIYCMKRMLGRPAELGDIFKGFDFFVPTLIASLIMAVFIFGGTLLCVIPGLVLT